MLHRQAQIWSRKEVKLQPVIFLKCVARIQLGPEIMVSCRASFRNWLVSKYGMGRLANKWRHLDDIVPAAELFRRLVRETEEARKRLDAADRRPPPGRPRAQRWSTRYGNGIFRASRFARTPPVVVLHGSARSVEHQASELNRVCSHMAPI